jgi:hypothetical protein
VHLFIYLSIDLAIYSFTVYKKHAGINTKLPSFRSTIHPAVILDLPQQELP